MESESVEFENLWLRHEFFPFLSSRTRGYAANSGFFSCGEEKGVVWSVRLERAFLAILEVNKRTSPMNPGTN